MINMREHALSQITQNYWRVSHGLRHNVPIEELTVLGAFKLLNSVTLRPTDWRLAELIHIIRYDIIEGNTRWRKNAKQQVRNTALILHMKNSISMDPLTQVEQVEQTIQKEAIL